MDIQLRTERSSDFDAVEEIIKAAFVSEPYSDQTEHLLVNRLRQSNAFIPELSIVAERNGELLGHILLTRIQIKNDQTSFDSLALAPVSVHPAYHRQGIGSQLILRAHELARELGHQSVILLGHEQYYPRFGYQPCQNYNIQVPFEAPAENCMAVELVEDGLKGVTGTVEYAKAFFE